MEIGFLKSFNLKLSNIHNMNYISPGEVVGGVGQEGQKKDGKLVKLSPERFVFIIKSNNLSVK